MPLGLRHVSDSAVLTGQRLVYGHLRVNAVAVAVIVQAIIAAQLAVLAQRRLTSRTLLLVVTSQRERGRENRSNFYTSLSAHAETQL